MRRTLLVPIMLLLILPQAVAADGQRPVFTRHVEQITGNWHDSDFWDSTAHGQVYGQDSCVVVEDPDLERLLFFFGDTLVPGPDISNSMAWTDDFEAADGIDLVYHLGANRSAGEVLTPTDEPRV